MWSSPGFNPRAIVILALRLLNDLPNSFEKLSFRIFADDTNILSLSHF